MSRNEESSPLLKRTRPAKEGPARQTFLQFLSNVTVEPALLLFSCGHVIDSIYIPQIQIDKICSLMLNFSAEICENLDSGSFDEEEDAVQKIASRFNVYQHWVEYLPALVSMLLLGAWGDTRDRKLPLIVSFVGCLLSSLILLASVYWWFLPASLTYLAFIPLGVMGSNLGVYMNISAYLSGISGTRSRTLRLSVVETLKYGTYPLGIYIALAVFERGGYVAVYAFQASLFAVAVVYLIVRLEKQRPTAVQRDPSRQQRVSEDLSPTRLKRSLALVWREREDGGRAQILGYAAIICIFTFDVGVKNIFYLYTQKRFSWEEESFSVWVSVDYIFHALGTLVVLPVLSYYLRVQDSLIVFVGGISAMFYLLLIGTAPQPWVLYLASATSLFMLMVTSAAKGKISKLVERRRVRNRLRHGVRSQRPHAAARHAGVQPRVQRHRGRVPRHCVRPPGGALCRYLLLSRLVVHTI
ncbi:uncharacterized protein LOC125033695 [Penaeus chinensis]|uniref:uncharacterized protein LOC125033695 n=1 Tax=Penaeus chinensis TaxID=139456 RepID=UPI001FB76D6D|nr:uncharacterized protein LOC125033695 [Penaeus chinensis]